MFRRAPAWITFAVLIVLGSAAGLIWRLSPRPPDAPSAQNAASIPELLAAARVKLSAQDWDAVLQLTGEILQRDPENSQAYLLAGEAATRQQDHPRALQFYAKAAAIPGPDAATALMAAAELQRVYGSLDLAERLYRAVLQQQPDQLTAVDRLAMLLKLTGRAEEAQPLLLQLVQAGRSTVPQLQWLADPARPARAEQFLEQSLTIAPQQLAARLGLVAQEVSRGEFATALPVLVQLRAQFPGTREVEALYGRGLFELGRSEEFQSWQAGLSDELLTSPAIWQVQGEFFAAQQQTDAALRCLLEAVQLDSDRRPALHQAGRLLIAAGRTSAGQPLLLRSELLTNLADLAGQVTPASPPELFIQIAERLEQLGRYPEALGWLAPLASSEVAAATDLPKRWSRLQALAAGQTQAATNRLPDIAALKEQFPLPDRKTTPSEIPTPLTDNSALLAGLSFVDQSQSLGIDFVYYEDPDETTPGRRMHEFTGGGVAALDFDQNGRPDLYFTQGAVLAKPMTAPTFHDQLFRNRVDGHFENCTESARLVEAEFSQGIAAGDVNNDGFPDLYVANIGRNRLFLNQGDGTFLEVMTPDLPVSNTWTTSCAIADLNGDGHPDLYDVTYVTGSDVYERRCPTPAGLRVCAPYAFAAAADRLCLSQGDGTFRDASDATGLQQPGGKGLGLLIGPLSGQGTPADLFIANDTEPNFLISLETPGTSPLEFRETALLAGVSHGADGQAQACMGVAAADFDQNGLLDLFVTNYFLEPNNLFLADQPGLYHDTHHMAGLGPASLKLLGFGTQAMDVNLDSHTDLVVVNGDLDDFSYENRPFRMRSQLLLNNGQARFTEWESAPEQDFFHLEHTGRGRGLARLDWNRDGRPDFAVSRLDEPAALVTNLTQTSGGFLTLRLVGTRSSRDAVGAQVTLQSAAAPSWQRHAWLTAGDGYQATNERVLHFGLGNQPGPFTLKVTWPSGSQAEYRQVTRGQSYLAIEAAPSILSDIP